MTTFSGFRTERFRNDGNSEILLRLTQDDDTNTTPAEPARRLQERREIIFVDFCVSLRGAKRFSPPFGLFMRRLFFGN